MSLEAAKRALEAKAYEEALALLLEAWRAQPSRALGDLVDHVSRRASEGLPSLRRKPLAAQWKAWLEVAAAGRTIDFERLAEVPMPRKWLEAERLLAALRSFEPDPRLSRFLCELMRAKTIYEQPGDTRPGQIRGFLFRQRARVLEQGDARVVAFFEDPELWPALSDHRGADGDQASEQDLVAALRRQAEPSNAVVNDLLRLFAAGATQKHQHEGDAAQLLEKIYEAPDDLGLRAVYADALATAGDPRGEFISMQLTGRSPSPAHQRLLKKHVHGWSGPLDRFFQLRARRFEGGFLVGGTLESPLTIDDLGSPAWRLVTDLNFGIGVSPRADVLAHPRLNRLRSLTIDLSELASLLERQWPGITSLSLEHCAAPVPQSLMKTFPALRRLGFRYVDDAAGKKLMAWLKRAPGLDALEVLHLENLDGQQLGDWWRALDASSVRAALISAGGWPFQLTRSSGSGRLSCVTIGKPVHKGTNGLIDLTATLPKSALTSVTVPKELRSVEHSIRKILERFEGVSIQVES